MTAQLDSAWLTWRLVVLCCAAIAGITTVLVTVGDEPALTIESKSCEARP